MPAHNQTSAAGSLQSRDRTRRDATAVAVALTLSAAIALGGCGGTNTAITPQVLAVAPVHRGLDAPKARILVTVPGSNSVQASRFTAQALITGFRLIRTRAGAIPHHNAGHLDFSLDHGTYDQPKYSGANGRLATERGVNGYYSLAYRPSITYRDIPPGHHTLVVQLVNTDDTLTGIQATVQFMVR